eukprot:TRINITY_DN20927_c0_g1_i1.p1 TRINITY_DN20927_c0_g1~~TRINITY_DN20927_c0_g1_i1.p1  ORF type:complete len:163 (+),score=0.01 TRINITY_DN20927_c0_g1_i1:219-707(+)
MENYDLIRKACQLTWREMHARQYGGIGFLLAHDLCFEFIAWKEFRTKHIVHPIDPPRRKHRRGGQAQTRFSSFRSLYHRSITRKFCRAIAPHAQPMSRFIGVHVCKDQERCTRFHRMSQTLSISGDFKLSQQNITPGNVISDFLSCFPQQCTSQKLVADKSL